VLIRIVIDAVLWILLDLRRRFLLKSRLFLAEGIM